MKYSKEKNVWYFLSYVHNVKVLLFKKYLKDVLHTDACLYSSLQNYSQTFSLFFYWFYICSSFQRYFSTMNIFLASTCVNSMCHFRGKVHYTISYSSQSCIKMFHLELQFCSLKVDVYLHDCQPFLLSILTLFNFFFFKLITGSWDGAVLQFLLAWAEGAGIWRVLQSKVTSQNYVRVGP